MTATLHPFPTLSPDQGTAVRTDAPADAITTRDRQFLEAMATLQPQPERWRRSLENARDLYLSAVSEILKSEFHPDVFEDALYDLKNQTADSLGDLIGGVDRKRGI